MSKTIVKTEMMGEVKIKSTSTVGSQISRVKTLLKSDKLKPQFTAQGIGCKAIATCIIACANNGMITKFTVKPYTNELGHSTMKASIETDSRRKQNSDDLKSEKFWNVSFLMFNNSLYKSNLFLIGLCARCGAWSNGSIVMSCS